MTELEIANLALAMIGKTRITDFTSEQKGQIAATLYPSARDYVLRRHDWSHSQKIRQLTSQESDREAWTRRFQFPADMVRISEIAPELSEEDKPDYELGRRFVYASTEEMWVKYVYRVEDAGLFDAMTAKAIATVLAGDLAMPLANSVEMQGKYEQMAELRIREAAHYDFMQNNPDRGDYTPWEDP